MVDEQEDAWTILYEHGYLKNTKNPSQNAFFYTGGGPAPHTVSEDLLGRYVRTHTHS